MKIIILLFAFIFSLISCTESVNRTADNIDAEKQKVMQKEAQAQAGMPAIHNFQEKKILKQIYELRDNEKLVCYAYLWNEFNGKLVFIGKCIGYGIPYATQYSNPSRPAEAWETHEAGNITLPQSEPNGLFMPSTSEGTWLMMIDKQGIPHAVYVEPRCVVSPFQLTQN